MKKPVHLILIGVITIVVVAFLKDKPKENLTANADISEELSQLQINNGFEKKPVNFARCEPGDGFKINLSLGSSKLTVIGPEDEFCLVQTTFETEGGHYINDCKIPLSLGQIIFSNDSFDEISQYCQLKTTGSGLLELE